MTSVTVWGASGHGKVVADAARLAGFTVHSFLDDAPEKTGTWWDGAIVLAPADGLARSAAIGSGLALGVGDNRARAGVYERALAAGLDLPILVHPSAVVASSAVIGPGTLVCAHAVLNPYASVGRAAIVNTGAVVEHDCEIGDFTHVSPGAVLGGGVRVGTGSHIAIGAIVLPGLRIGDRTIVGAGAVVTKDVPSDAVVVGVPARARSISA